MFDKSICFQGRTFFCIVWLILTFFKGFLKFWRKDQTHTDRQSAHCLFVIERERVTGDLEMNSFWFSFSFPLSLSALCSFPHHPHISSSFSSSSSSPDFGSISNSTRDFLDRFQKTVLLFLLRLHSISTRTKKRSNLTFDQLESRRSG